MVSASVILCGGARNRAAELGMHGLVSAAAEITLVRDTAGSPL